MSEPTREEIDTMTGPVVLEFGTGWCPHCQAIQSFMADVRVKYPQVRHIAIEDGKGRPLGRSFRVKLWPTLVFLRDGWVVGETVRPTRDEITKGFDELVSGRTAAPEPPGPHAAVPPPQPPTGT